MVKFVTFSANTGTTMSTEVVEFYLVQTASSVCSILWRWKNRPEHNYSWSVPCMQLGVGTVFQSRAEVIFDAEG